MARKIPYNINRFDGGMTDAIRNTSDPTKFSFISHFDIYRDPNQMYVMPGFESFNGFASDANGLKIYDVRTFTTSTDDRLVYAVGTKSDGTGSKVFQVNESTPDTEWSVATSTVEGTNDLLSRPFFRNIDGFFLYPASNAGNLIIGKNGASAYATITPGTSVITSTDRYSAEKAFNGVTYVTNSSFSNVRSLTSTAFSDAKSIGGTGRDLASGDYTVGVAQSLTSPTGGSVLIWDAASLLADQNIRLNNTRPLAIGYVNGGWTIANETGLYENSTVSGGGNGVSSIAVNYISGESTYKLWEYRGYPAAQFTENDMFSVKGNYQGTAMFHARMATDSGQTTFISGVFAVGNNRPDSPVAVSQLLNTSSLGVVETVYNSGRRFYFAHGLDGSVSRLQRFDTGTYDVPAVIETLIYGSESPYQKELNGMAVVTENLPSGASIKAEYRTDVDSSWTELATSSTVGKQKHVFTRASGTPIGKFQEIQFRITATGKITIKNIKFDLTETDDLSF